MSDFTKQFMSEGNGKENMFGKSSPVAFEAPEHSIHNQKWLVRIPVEVCALWDSLEQQDTVGTITVGKGDQMTLSLKVIEKEQKQPDVVRSQELEEGEFVSPQTSEPSVPAGPSSASGVKTGKGRENVFPLYSLSEYGTSLQKNMMVMKSTKDTHTVIGTVKRKFKAFPVRGDEYTEFVKRKNENFRKTQMPIKLKKPVVNYKPVSNHQNNIDYEKKKKNERRYRMERDELTQKLFELFEAQQYYSFKGLLALTNQPSSFLKEILKEYCNFNAHGTNRSCWELKPEYRHYAEKDDD